jgi:regulator of replication initiation timing
MLPDNKAYSERALKVSAAYSFRQYEDIRGMHEAGFHIQNTDYLQAQKDKALI